MTYAGLPVRAVLLHGEIYCCHCEAGPENCGMLVPVPNTMPSYEAQQHAVARFRQPRQWEGLTCQHCGADYHHLLPCNPAVVLAP